MRRWMVVWAIPNRRAAARSYPLTQSASVDEDQKERGFEAIDDSSMNDQIKPRTESGLWGIYLA